MSCPRTPYVPIIETIWLAKALIDQLRALADKHYPNEVGGILAGYINGNGAVVTEIVGPGPLAEHRPQTFLPDHAFQPGRISAVDGKFDKDEVGTMTEHLVLDTAGAQVGARAGHARIEEAYDSMREQVPDAPRRLVAVFVVHLGDTAADKGHCQRFARRDLMKKMRETVPHHQLAGIVE